MGMFPQKNSFILYWKLTFFGKFIMLFLNKDHNAIGMDIVCGKVDNSSLKK